jgi:hypothetical protein
MFTGMVHRAFFFGFLGVAGGSEAFTIFSPRLKGRLRGTRMFGVVKAPPEPESAESEIEAVLDLRFGETEPRGLVRKYLIPTRKER